MDPFNESPAPELQYTEFSTQYLVREKEIVICTKNAKNITNFTNKIRSNNKDNHKTKLYIRRALRHEATHMIQACNGDKIIGDINEIKKKILNWVCAWIIFSMVKKPDCPTGPTPLPHALKKCQSSSLP